jgi:hypothetical protein
MRRFFLSLVLVLTLKCFAADRYIFLPQGTFTYSSYGLDGFSLKKGHIYAVEKNQKLSKIGTVENLNEWTTRAYAFKVGDLILSTHRASLLSYGSIFDCLKQYEIYDENNQVIGFIEGSWDSSAAAHFFFYKGDRELFAQAILDPSYSKLTISTPDGQVLITGEKTKNVSDYYSWFSSSDEYYYWEFKKEKKELLNELFFWPFIAFLSEVWWK